MLTTNKIYLTAILISVWASFIISVPSSDANEKVQFRKQPYFKKMFGFTSLLELALVAIKGSRFFELAEASSFN